MTLRSLKGPNENHRFDWLDSGPNANSLSNTRDRAQKDLSRAPGGKLPRHFLTATQTSGTDGSARQGPRFWEIAHHNDKERNSEQASLGCIDLGFQV